MFSRTPDSFGCLWRSSSRLWGEVCSPRSTYAVRAVGTALALIPLSLVLVADLLGEQRHELFLCRMKPRLSGLEPCAAFPVLLVPRIIAVLESVDFRHALHALWLVWGWILLLPALSLFANATHVFLRLVELVYGRPNLLVSLLGSVVHQSSPGHRLPRLRCSAPPPRGHPTPRTGPRARAGPSSRLSGALQAEGVGSKPTQKENGGLGKALQARALGQLAFISSRRRI